MFPFAGPPPLGCAFFLKINGVNPNSSSKCRATSSNDAGDFQGEQLATLVGLSVVALAKHALRDGQQIPTVSLSLRFRARCGRATWRRIPSSPSPKGRAHYGPKKNSIVAQRLEKVLRNTGIVGGH